MDELRVFTNEEFGELRTIIKDEEILFIGKEVVIKLGYDCSVNSYSKYVKQFVDEEDYIILKKSELDLFGISDVGRKGEYLINESGLYSLALSSELPSAKRFKRWITKDVLPQIRKTGGYIPVKAEDTDETIMAKAYLIATETLKRQEELVSKLQPLADIAETRIEKKGCMSITDVTKSLGFKRGQITRWAKAKGYLHMSLTEVNALGQKYFKIYSSDCVHNQIGVLEDGIHLIEQHKEEIMNFRNA